MTLNLMQIDINLKSSIRALDAYQAALEARVAAVESQTIISNNTNILANVMLITPTNMNQAETVYFRYGTSSTDTSVSYARGKSFFQIRQEGDYTISANLHCDNGLANERAILFMYCRIYASFTRSDRYTDHILGNAYYRDDNDDMDSFNMGGCIRLYVTPLMATLGFSFEICSTRIDAADTTATIMANAGLSTITIDRLVYAIS